MTHPGPRSIRLVRAISFSAAHRYFASSESNEKNRSLYGSLYREHGFGHNFRVEAHFTGQIDALTGMIVNLKHVDRWLKDVAETVDHRHLNELPAFAGIAPTPERLALYWFEQLASRVASHLENHPGVLSLVKTRLYEGESLWVDCFVDCLSKAPEAQKAVTP